MTQFTTKPSTFVELLRWRAQHQAEQCAYIFLQDDNITETQLTYTLLDEQAQTIAAHLQQIGQPNDRVLLLYAPGLAYISAFFGCLYAGMIPVPCYPPRLHRPDKRLQRIVEDASATTVLTTENILVKLTQRFTHIPTMANLRWLATDSLTPTERWHPPTLTGDNIALLQYTSGSTAAPKGVTLTYHNLLYNSRLIQQCFGHTPESHGVIWLPPYHDMGLIGGILQPLYVGFPVTLMAPVNFLRRPLSWLEAISKYRATTSGGPNFAYDLCVEKVSEADRQSVDLSCWQVAFNGAEPIRPRTLTRFVETFASCGFASTAFYPCFGLAEATLIVTGAELTATPVIKSFDKTGLGKNRVTPLSDSNSQAAQTLVSSGYNLTGQQLLIVDPDTKTVCPSHHIGEIWVSGPSVAIGYWNKPEQTEETFGAQLADAHQTTFLRTGDLGFLYEKQLFVTGRQKDLIIIRGRNYYPQDIEQVAKESHPVLQTGEGAAFSIDVDGHEQLIVVHELQRHYRRVDLNEVVDSIQRAISEHHMLQIYGVVLVKPRRIPRTSSGKIQRYLCRAHFINGDLEIVHQYIRQAPLFYDVSQQYEGETIGERLAILVDSEERQNVLIGYLQAQIAQILTVSIAQVATNKSLSTLGADSLAAVELSTALERDLDVFLSMATLLEMSSLDQLTTAVLRQIDHPPDTTPLPTVDDATKYPLSDGQRALWYLHQLAPQSTAYNIANAVRITSPLDVDALQKAFQQLVNRHPVLQTTFQAPQGQPIQQTYRERPVQFHHIMAIDWSQNRLMNRLNEEAHTPFNLEEGALFRVFLFTQTNSEHVLLLTLHHILIDFWSIGILLRELETIYLKQQPLPSLQRQYADYVHWQNEWLHSERGKQHQQYWQTHLAPPLPSLNLPTDYARPIVQSFRGASQNLRLSPQLTQQLQTLSRAHNVTLYMTLLAAFQTLLHRYTGQDDILIGSPALGRNRSDFADVVGFFVNTIVLRGDLSNDPPFVTLLAQTRVVVLDALAHQDYPFARLAQQMQPNRDPSRSPIYQVMFIWQQSPWLAYPDLAGFALDEPGIHLALKSFPIESVGLTRQAAQVDLTLSMSIVQNQLIASLEYNIDLFAADTVARMLAHLQTLLTGVVSQPEARLSALPLLTLAERQQLLTTWNPPIQLGDQHTLNVHHLIEAQVARTPTATAVIFGNERLTYAQLNQQANQLAHYLMGMGVGPETLVGVHIHRAPLMVVAVIAILKAGAAYVPLDPAFPEARLAYMIQDTRLTVILSEESLRHNFPPPPVQTIALDAQWSAITQLSSDNPTTHVDGDNLVYIIYTSGSTGNPKGVPIHQDGLINVLEAYRQQFPITAQDNVLAMSTLSFDIANVEIVLPLLVGATIILVDAQTAVDGDQLSQIMDDNGVTVMQGTPTTWRLLLESGWEGNQTLRMLCGGEPLYQELATQLLQRGAALWNIYGPTETTIWSNLLQVTEIETNMLPVGPAIPNIHLYVLDNHLQPVPIGVPGELHIAGIGLSRGYIHDPQFTAQKFIPHPFTTSPGARMYKTGDIVSYRRDGNLEFLGRADHQVKVRGFRIELGEIESVLGTHTAVKKAVTVAQAITSTVGEKRLVAYIVPEPGQTPNTSALRHFLQEKLPHYMIPSTFVFLDAFPLTPNKKVNRNALPKPQGVRPELDATYIAPQDEIERTIATIWQNALQVEQVGIHDNFFDLGGHSLLMAHVHRQMQDTLQIDVPLVKLLEYPTIQTLSHYLSQQTSPDLHTLQQSRERARKQRSSRRRHGRKPTERI